MCHLNFSYISKVGRRTDHSYPVAHGVCGQVGLEARAHAARVAVRPRHLAPDGAQLRLLAAGTARDGCALLSPTFYSITQ